MDEAAASRLEGRDALERGRLARVWDRGASLMAADDSGVLTEPRTSAPRVVCPAHRSPELAEAHWARAHECFVDRGDIRGAVR